MKKLVSILLTLTMILGILSIIPMSASAQEVDQDKVYVKTDGQYYEAEKGQRFTYEYLISVDSSRKVATYEVNMFYDTDGLDFVPYCDEYGDVDYEKHFPKGAGAVVYNFGIDGQILYNYANYLGITMGENSVLFKGEFEVTADSGVYEIDSKMITCSDVDMVTFVFQGIKYDEYGESEVITDLNVNADITEPATEPEKNQVTVYLVDSLNWDKNGSIFALAYSGVKGEEGYIQNAEYCGEPMARTAQKSPDGASVFKVYVDENFENLYFALGYYPKTKTTNIRADQYFDNATNRWYKNLSDVPAYVESETVIPTQPAELPTAKPTVKPTIKPQETEEPTESPIDEFDKTLDGLYVKADGVYYKAEKGQKFTYEYRISLENSKRIAGINVHMFYDTEGLDFVPYYDEYEDVDFMRHYPKIYGNTVYNFNIDGVIYYNYSNIYGVKLDDNSVIFTGEFEVTADSGVYEIYSYLEHLGYPDMTVVVNGGKKYDEYEDSEIITDLIVATDIVPPPTEPTEKRYTVYFVDTVNANTTKKEIPVFVHAVKGEAGSDDYIENSALPGQVMARVDLDSPTGAIVRKAYISSDFDKVRFGYNGSNFPSMIPTAYVEIKDGYFFDNGTNKWYENLADIPAYVPTEPPTVIPTEPDEQPTVKPQPTQKPNPTEKPTLPHWDNGVYVIVDGVKYAVNKGDVFRYNYYLSVDRSLKISSIDVHMKYDTEGLDFKPYYDMYGDEDVFAHFPSICGSCVHNFAIDGEIYYNYSSVAGIRLTNNALVFTGEFEVTADRGTYNIDTILVTLADADLNKIVYNKAVVQDVFTEKSELDRGEIIYPTEALPTEPLVEPTEGTYDDPIAPPYEPSTEPPGLPGAPSVLPTEPDIDTEGDSSVYDIGDVNRDGDINIFDVTLIQRYAAEYVMLDDEQITLANTNFDDKINIFDATEIQRFIAGYISAFVKK